MIDAVPVCYDVAYTFHTTEKDGTFQWRINLKGTSVVLKHGEITGKSGVYHRIACVKQRQGIKAFGFYDKGVATLSVKVTRWLRK